MYRIMTSKAYLLKIATTSTYMEHKVNVYCKKDIMLLECTAGDGGGGSPPNETLQIEIDLPCLLFLVRQVRRNIKNKNCQT